MDLKYSICRLIDLARVEPVTVAKHGHPVVVIMAVEEYERLKALGSPRNTAVRKVFVGSDHGGMCAAAIYALIGAARLNDINPHAWLADTPQTRLHELLPWQWKSERQISLAA